MSDVWCLMSDFWLLISDFWFLMSDFWLLISDFWILISDLWFLISDFWFLISLLFINQMMNKSNCLKFINLYFNLFTIQNILENPSLVSMCGFWPRYWPLFWPLTSAWKSTVLLYNSDARTIIIIFIFIFKWRWGCFWVEKLEIAHIISKGG